MGDLFVEYFGKCTAGLADAARRGREPSPTTQENCAVAMRELRNKVKAASVTTPTPTPKPTPTTPPSQSQRKHLMPPPKAKPNILFRSAQRPMTPKEHEQWRRDQQIRPSELTDHRK